MNKGIDSENWNCKIDGKTNGAARMIILFIIALIFLILMIDQLLPQKNKYLIIAAIFGSIAAVAVYYFIKLSVRYFCFKVYIGTKGFYYQSNPFNGKYYEYKDIKSCAEELNVSHSNLSTGFLQFYYFTFTDKNNRYIKFQFEKSTCGHEINKLKKRIEKELNGNV